MFKGQDQEVGDGALALQAGGNIHIHTGVTATEARNIALDVAKATFTELSHAARGTAEIRVEEITDQIISKLEKEYPEGLQKAVDPDFQYALFTVQKQFGRSGDKDLGSLLVDLLVDRSKQDERNILQIVLNESLDVAPKLTANHLATLAAVFTFRYVKSTAINNIESLCTFLDQHVQPYADRLSRNPSAFQHLEYTGCGALQLANHSLSELLLVHYPGLFMRGFTMSEAASFGLPIQYEGSIYIPCIHSPDKMQIGAMDEVVLDELISTHSISKDKGDLLKQFFSSNKMTEEAVRALCVSHRPYMENVFERWDNAFMRRFTLTSVGIAIGHAYLKQFVPGLGDLSIWID